MKIIFYNCGILCIFSKVSIHFFSFNSLNDFLRNINWYGFQFRNEETEFQGDQLSSLARVAYYFNNDSKLGTPSSFYSLFSFVSALTKLTWAIVFGQWNNSKCANGGLVSTVHCPCLFFLMGIAPPPSEGSGAGFLEVQPRPQKYGWGRSFQTTCPNKSAKGVEPVRLHAESWSNDRLLF